MEFFQLTDQTISDITDELSFGVVKGASNNSFQQFEAQTKSSSSINVNINVPSESIILNRKVMLQTTLNFEIEITGVPSGPGGKDASGNDLPGPQSNVFNYGSNAALQAFPINSLFNNITCSINNTNVNCNLKDILPQLLLLNNNKLLAQYNSTSPSQPDYYYKNYKDGVGNSNNVLGGYKNTLSNDLSPRGAYVLDGFERFYMTKGKNTWTKGDTNDSKDPKDRFLIQMTVTTTEPFIGLSPFIFGDPKHNSQGLVGINSLNFMMNIGEPNRMFSYAGPGDDAKPVGSSQSIRLGHTNTASSSSSSTSKEAFSSCKVLCNFLTAQDTDVIDAKNVVPYLDFPRFITNGTQPSNPLSSTFGINYSQKLTSYTVQTNNIQLNQLPDYFIVVVRKPMIEQKMQGQKASSKKIPNDNVELVEVNTGTIDRVHKVKYGGGSTGGVGATDKNILVDTKFKSISNDFYKLLDRAINYSNKQNVKFFDMVDEQVWTQLSNVFTVMNSDAYNNMKAFSLSHRVSISGELEKIPTGVKKIA